MKKTALYLLYSFSLLLTVVAFLFSCIVTMSDGQGALIFAVTIPVMGVLLFVAGFSGRELDKTKSPPTNLKKIPTILVIAIATFFVISMVPGLNRLSSSFMGFVGKTFEFATGKTPYTYFKERKSFPNLLKLKLDESRDGQINFDLLNVTFAWDKFCIFGPNTSNDQAKKVLNMDWNIEERSTIAHSDSINALVFLYQGKLNVVIDLARTLADFENPNRCFDRSQTHFLFRKDQSGRTFILLP